MIYECLFSATGRTGKVLDILSAAFPGEKRRIDLSDPRMEGCSLQPDDLCILASSVFEGRLPAPAAKNFEKLSGGGAKILLVAVFGNRAVDDCLLEMKDLAVRQGFVPVAAIEAVAQHSILTRVEPDRPDREDQTQLGEFAAQVAQLLADQQRFGELEVPGKRPYVEMGGIPFKPTGSRKCIGCGKCAAQCPMQAIPTDKPRVTDKTKCITCMRCVEVCPVRARDFHILLQKAAWMAMKSKFDGRKPNRLYLVK